VSEGHADTRIHHQAPDGPVVGHALDDHAILSPVVPGFDGHVLNGALRLLESAWIGVRGGHVTDAGCVGVDGQGDTQARDSLVPSPTVGGRRSPGDDALPRGPWNREAGDQEGGAGTVADQRDAALTSEVGTRQHQRREVRPGARWDANHAGARVDGGLNARVVGSGPEGRSRRALRYRSGGPDQQGDGKSKNRQQVLHGRGTILGDGVLGLLSGRGSSDGSSGPSPRVLADQAAAMLGGQP
jgi:hypothetical protein